MTTDHTHGWAQHLASRGWAVFPLAPGTKRPAIREWEHRATTDPKRIKGCWYAGAGFGIGIATGRLIHKSNLITVTTPSPSDVSVIL